jgi:hypothetical protein
MGIYKYGWITYTTHIRTGTMTRNKATIPPRAYAARFAVHFTQQVVAVEASCVISRCHGPSVKPSR